TASALAELLGSELQTQFLLDRSGQETAHAMRLPAGEALHLLEARPLRAGEKGEQGRRLGLGFTGRVPAARVGLARLLRAGAFRLPVRWGLALCHGLPPRALHHASRVLASHTRSGGRRHQAKEPIIPLLSGAHADYFLTGLDRPVFARSASPAELARMGSARLCPLRQSQCGRHCWGFLLSRVRFMTLPDDFPTASHVICRYYASSYCVSR